MQSLQPLGAHTADVSTRRATTWKLLVVTLITAVLFSGGASSAAIAVDQGDRPLHTVTIEYSFDEEFIELQSFSLAKGDVLTASQLAPPAGFQLTEPFQDFMVTGDVRIELTIEPQPAVVHIEYVFEGSTVSEQRIHSTLWGQVTESDLVPPYGYELLHSFSDYTILEPQPRLSLELRRVTFTTAVRYEDTSGRPVGTEEGIKGFLGQVLTASDLLAVPGGYELVNPNFSYVVTGSSVLILTVREAAVEPDSFAVTVVYTLNGTPLEGTGHTISDVPAGNEITGADLRVPKGYRLANAFTPQTINANTDLRIPVELIPTSGAVVPPTPSVGGQLATTGNGALLPPLALAGLLALVGCATLGHSSKRSRV